MVEFVHGLSITRYSMLRLSFRALALVRMHFDWFSCLNGFNGFRLCWLLLFAMFFVVVLEMTIRGTIRDDDTQVLKVERPFYQQQQFNSELSYCKPDTTGTQSCSAWMNDIKPLKFISSIFPIFTWMSQYNVRSDLICDLISGCTVAVMHIPQGKLNEFVQSDSASAVWQNCIVFSCTIASKWEQIKK